MSRHAITYGLIFIGLFTIGALSVYATPSVLFQDDFESGNLSTTANGFRWDTNNNVSSAKGLSGKHSMAFLFSGGPHGEDAWAEKRIYSSIQRTELWIKYDIYIPSNYYHRSDDDGASNNKFFAIFNNGYRPGYQVNFSMYPGENGGSVVGIHYYKNGEEQSFIYEGTPIFTPEDFGKWHRIVMHFKVPTTLNSSDGVQQLWKNGTNLFDITDLQSNGTSGKNYIDEAYIMGWANSGFDEDTIIYVDNVVISEAPIALK